MRRTFPADSWFTSSYTTREGKCVEVNMQSDAVGIRDTKDRAGGQLAVPAGLFAAFVAKVQSTDGWRG